jgi:hypothetical protein
MTQPGFLPLSFMQSHPDTEKTEKLIRHRLPSSLESLRSSEVFHEADASIIVEAVASLKLQGEFQTLKTVMLKFLEPRVLQHMGFPPRTLDELRTCIEAEVGESFAKAVLELKVETSL